MSQPSRETESSVVERPTLWRDLREGVAVVDRITRGWLAAFGRRQARMAPGIEMFDKRMPDSASNDNVIHVDFRRPSAR